MKFSRERSTEFRFTGWHMLACMIAFFGTIIAVNVTMATLASGTWTGLVVKNSYVASQKFNDQLADARKQARAGLSSEVTHSSGILTFRIRNREGASVNPNQALVWIGRPAFEQLDRTLEVSCAADGICQTAVEFQPGAWDMRIEAELPTGAYRRDARLFVSADGKVRVE